MTRLPRTAFIGLAATLGVAAAGSASAATLAALQDGKTIVWIDTDQKKVIGKVGLDGGASLVGFDVRPADGKLYGLTPQGAIVTIDVKTGKWEKKSQLSEKLPEGAAFSVDFNPVADRMRVVSSTGMSYRINVDDGKTMVDGALKYADADAMKGKEPKVTAAAYSNSYRRHQGDRALRHRRGARHARQAGAAQRRHPQHHRQARREGGRRPSPSTSGRTARAPTPAGCWPAARSTRSILPPAPPSPSARCRASRAKSATSPSCRRCSSRSVAPPLPVLTGRGLGPAFGQAEGEGRRQASPLQPVSPNTSPRPSTERLTIPAPF